MGRINVEISDELDDRFRREVGRRLGMKRGNLGKAVIEAIELWLSKE